MSWEEYEELLEQVGEANWLRISYDERTLSVVAVSSKHEIYTRFLESLMTAFRLRLHINLTEHPTPLRIEGELQAWLAFDNWLQQKQAAIILKRVHKTWERRPPCLPGVIRNALLPVGLPPSARQARRPALPGQSDVCDYSYRSAIIGSTFVARRAGSQQANNATSANNSAITP